MTTSTRRPNTKLLTVVVLAALLVGASGAQASGAGGEVGPTFRIERQYAHCAGDSKIQNVPAVHGQSAPLTTTAPAASVQAGAGCGTVTAPGTTLGLTWTGSFTGNIKTITVEVHSIYVGAGRALEALPITPELTIDGVSIFIPTYVWVTPVRSSTGASEKLVFTIADLDTKLPLEDGEGKAVHSLELQVHAAPPPVFCCSAVVIAVTTGTYNHVHGFVWDTTEVPSGITVNRTTELGTTVAAS